MNRALVLATLAALRIETEPRPRGKRLWGRCPFHTDKNPSWFIRPDGRRAGQHHCFVCQEGGTLAELVAAVLGLSMFEADIWLAELGEHGAPPEPAPVDVAGTETTGGLFAAESRFRLPPEVILEPLAQWPTPARRYAERRGLTPAQVTRWRIGHAVHGRLAGRVVLTTWARHGGALRAAAYQARTYAGEEPRYQYPRGSERPDLDVLFGEMFWPPAPARRAARLVVVEGGLKALALDRVGVPYVAALGGSHIRPAHVTRLATFGEVVLLTDADKAGSRAEGELAAALVRHVPRLVRGRLPCDPDEMTPADLSALLSRL